MAKRLTDTAKWEKEWFRKLSPIEKCIWFFLCDRCDHAGIWEIDNDAFEYFIGQKYDIKNIVKAFDGRIELLGDKLFVRAFVDFQYQHLNPENRVHRSVLTRLERLKIKVHASPLQGAKDTYTNKDSCINTATPRVVPPPDDGPLLDEGKIWNSLPIITQEKLKRDYPDGLFIEKCVKECVTYHSSNPTAPRWTPLQWGRAITSWIVKASQSKKPERKV